MSDKKIEYNPEKNHNAISLIKQEDGNWKGWMWKNGKLLEERQGDPSTVLLLLLTHE